MADSDHTLDAAANAGSSASLPAPRRPGYYLFVGEGRGDDGVQLLDLWEIVWSQRLLVIALTALAAVASIAVALLLTPIYRADAVLAPVKSDDVRGLAGQLGGLASLAGIRLGSSADDTNGLAVLRSRAFAEAFISDHNLLPVLFEDQWDAAKGRWLSDDPADAPTMYDALKRFREDVFSVQEDLVTGLVTVVIEWRDPEQAADWVNDLVKRINVQMRSRDLSEAEKNLVYLRQQLAESNFVELQKAISQLIENELQTAMLARAREEYAFTIIDPAIVPTERSRPHRTLIVIVSTAAGGLLAVLVAMLVHTIRGQITARRRAPGA
jgi:uncharacterized protein involved in exopolysaccharide biosynthesis